MIQNLNKVQESVVIIALDNLIESYKYILESTPDIPIEDKQFISCTIQEAKVILSLFNNEIPKPGWNNQE